MELLNNFISEYATLLIYTALTAIFGALAAFIKKKYQEKADTKTKKEIVKQCVLAVEQLYKTLDGSEKKEKAVEAISDMLAEKGIAITPLEINILIEACVGELNGVFEEIKADEDYDIVSEIEDAAGLGDGYEIVFVPGGITIEEDEDDEEDPTCFFVDDTDVEFTDGDDDE